MSKAPLAEQVDPRELAAREATLTGWVAVASLPRLVEAAASAHGDVEVELRFAYDWGRRCVVKGFIRGEVELICQRCLEVYRQPLEAQVSLGVVTNDEDAANLPEEYDPLIVDSERLATPGLVEDELLLALPVVAAHSWSECPVAGRLQQLQPSKDESSMPRRENPFAALEQLKKK